MEQGFIEMLNKTEEAKGGAWMNHHALELRLPHRGLAPPTPSVSLRRRGSYVIERVYIAGRRRGVAARAAAAHAAIHACRAAGFRELRKESAEKSCLTYGS